MKRIKLIIILSAFCYLHSFGAYLRNIPITIAQPDGTTIECFATGDEYYNWVHDKDGYTIIQDKKTGYYCYAILVGDDLVASQYVIGSVSPKSVNIEPYINISGEKIREKVNEIIRDMPQKEALRNSGTQSRGAITGTINNIVIYIRFADQDTFPAEQSQRTVIFNSTDSADASMRNYFREVSYNQLDIVSHFYPINNGTTILSYQDPHNRNYYCPYDPVSNPSGYISRVDREHTLLSNAINFVKNQIPSSLNIDYDNDGYVDNVCFIIRGSNSGYNNILWPHKGQLWSQSVDVYGKMVSNYNVLLETSSIINSSIICHEMNHTFGAPDLEHINQDNMDVVRPWDLMGEQLVPPQHMGAYMKYKYGGWISSIPSITTSGTYTLQPLTSSTNNCYKIPFSSLDSSRYYIVVEYRKKTGVFESSIPGSGLIIYRINESRFPWGNANGIDPGGASDEVYVFRPDGTFSSKGDIYNAYFSETSGRTTFSNSTNPHCFDVDNNYGNIYIKNIRENANGTLSFDVRFCDSENITYSNTSNLPSLSNASNSIQTSGTVVVKNTDNIIFEAENKITLNSGFKIQLGGTFKINMNECGEK